MTSTSLRTAMLLTSLVFVASCAGNKKKTETAAAPAASTPAKTETAATDKKADKKVEKKAKAETAVAKEAASDKVSKAGTLTCKSGSESRSIEVAGVNGGCETKYTKGGETKTMATAKAGTEYCEQVSGKIKGNLEAAGYKCE